MLRRPAVLPPPGASPELEPVQPAVLVPPQVGLYDHAGMLRFAGETEADCLAYAALFGLGVGSYSLVPLGSAGLLPLR